MRLCELENKEVINACDCKKLGYVVDLIIDECKGCIEALVIPKGGKLCIRKIGPDIILVEIHEEG